MTRNSYSIAVLAGDGIGPEVTEPTQDLLRAAAAKAGFSLKFHPVDAGAEHYRATGTAFDEADFEASKECDAILLSAMGHPDIRYPDGTEIAPQLELRERLELYAGVRPVRTIPGVACPLADPRAQALDFVLIRESTEGLFAGRGKTELIGNHTAIDRMIITRSVCERLFDFAFALGRQRKMDGKAGKVTCVDKANVLGAMAFFRSIFLERAGSNRDVIADTAYVDAIGLQMVKHPWSLDVLVTENMFGDILSDVGAALLGGMGFAPSADIGDHYAVFQPCHGSAPDIAGQGKANPTAMFLSAAMMLDWLGRKHDDLSAQRGAQAIQDAVDRAFRDGGLRPYELGGTAGTKDIADAVLAEFGLVSQAR